MKRISTFFSNRKRISLILILSSLFALVLFGTPLIQSSLSENKSNKSTKTIGQSTALLVPNISASMVNTISTDNDGDTKADPGDVIQYTATITNSGADPATGVSFNATLDANTTFVPLSVDISPIAVNDGYSSIGNVGITVPAGSGVLANDLNPNGGALTIMSAPSSSTNGGAVSVNTTDGSFTYNPPVGFEGSDTFTYTLGNGTGLTDTGTVTITVSGMIWFINNNAGACSATCNGRLSNPFTTLAAFNTVNVGGGSNPDNNDNIFIYESSTGYSGAVTLRTGQKLIGQDATATLASVAGVTVPTFSNALPAMNTSAPTTNITSTVTLNTNTTLRGFSINSTTATGVSGGAISGVTTSEVAVTTTTGTAVSLNGTGGTISFTSVSSSGAATGISLTNTTGSFTVTGNGGTCTAATPTCTGGTIANSTDSGVKLSNANNVNLTRMRINGSGNFGLSGSTVTVMNIDTCVFDGVHGNAVDEGALFVTNWLTSGTVSNSEILGGANDNMRVHNTGGVLNRLTISNSIIRNTNAVAPGNHGLRFATVLASNTGAGTVMNLTVTGSTFQNNTANHFDAGATGLSTMDLVLSGNTFVTNGGFTTLAGAVNTTVDHQADVTFDYNGNSMNGAQLSAFNFFSSNLTTAASSMIGKFRNNTIGTTGVVGSGSAQGNGVDFNMTGLMTLTANITNNQIRRYGGNFGILVQGGDTSPVINATITGNTVKEGGPSSFQAIHLNSGTTAAGAVTACIDIGGAGVLRNDVLGSGGVAEIRVRQRNSSVVQLPGLTGAVDAFLAGRNIVTGTSSVTFQGVFGNNGGASCAQAPIPNPADENENLAVISTDEPKSNFQTETAVSNELSLTTNGLASLRETFSRIYDGLTDSVSILDFVPSANAQKGNITIEASNLPAAIGTLPAGKSVMVRFRASVNNPLPTPQVSPSTPAVASVSAMGTVSGSNFSSTNTNASSRNIEVPSNVVSGNGTTVFGQNVMLTATVSATGTTPNGGTVRFFDGTTQIGTDQVLTGGTASVTTTSLSVGTHNNIRAVYNGQNGVNGSISTAVTQTVNMANTTTTITNAVALGTATNVGQSYAVNWSVTVNSPGSGTPIGNVTVSDGTDTCMAAASAGTCNLTSTTSGLKNITAMYAGDTNFNTSTSASVPHTVNVPTATDVPVDFDGDGKSDPAVIVASMPLFADEEVVVVGGDILARERQRIWSDSYQRLLHLRSGRGFVELPKDVQAAQWKWNNSSTKNPFESIEGVGLTWQIRQSSNGATLTYNLGNTNDIIVPCDYDGDGRADAAVWTPSIGMFTVLFSSDLSTHTYTLGNMTSDPTVVGDYDGDGKCDPAVYDKSTGMWSYLGGTNHTVLTQVTFGANGIPAPGDYDGDGKFDFGVQVPPATATDIAKFRIAYNDGTVTVPDLGIAYGLAIFSIVPGDYDGDGKTDIAQANLMGTDITWRVLQSSTGYMVQVKTDFGLVATDRTVQGDYDGDGKTDLAVFRSAMSPQDGVFIIRQSSTSTTVTIDFGGLNDYPVAFFNTH